MAINIKGSALPPTPFEPGDAVIVNRTGGLAKIVIGDLSTMSVPGSPSSAEEGDTVLAIRSGAMVRVHGWMEALASKIDEADGRLTNARAIADGDYVDFSVVEGTATLAPAGVMAALGTLTEEQQRGLMIALQGFARVDGATHVPGAPLVAGATEYEVDYATSEPIGLALLTKEVVIEIFAGDEDVETGDDAGDVFFPVPSSLDGTEFVAVAFVARTAGETGTTDVQIMRKRGGTTVDMLSTAATIDSTETSSNTAATPLVIDDEKDDVATDDVLTFGVDAVSTTEPKGLVAVLQFRAPIA